MLGYLCAYFRHYHPLEFITSFLNNAANEDDIRNGTAYANKVGIKILQVGGIVLISRMDIIGKIVCSADFSDKTYPINTSNLKAGIYIVKINGLGLARLGRRAGKSLAV